MNRRYPFDFYRLTTFEDKKILCPRTISWFLKRVKVCSAVKTRKGHWENVRSSLIDTAFSFTKALDYNIVHRPCTLHSFAFYFRSLYRCTIYVDTVHALIFCRSRDFQFQISQSYGRDRLLEPAHFDSVTISCAADSGHWLFFPCLFSFKRKTNPVNRRMKNLPRVKLDQL